MGFRWSSKLVFPWSLDQEGAIPRRQDKIANRSIGAGDLEMRIPGETPSAGETYKETRERQFNFLAAAGRVGQEAKKVLSGAGGLALEFPRSGSRASMFKPAAF